MIDDLISLVAERARGRRPFLVGIGGPVSVGKTVLAEALAEALPAVVLGTDAYLFPNAVLDARDLTWRKGFPETFDVDALAGALDELRRTGRVTTPVYSHAVYDVLPGGAALVAGDIVIVEGVNALQDPVYGALDLAIYLDANEDVVREWFVERFLAFRDQARRDARSFYAPMAELDDDAIRDLAVGTWDAINGPNLREHIQPTRRRAHVVVVKDARHRITELRRA